jgi:hypothetical protein
MAQSLPKARQGLGEPQPKGARVLAPCLNPPHAQKTLQSGLKSPDGLLDLIFWPYGLCDLGMGFPEFGTVSLEELAAYRGRFGLGIERDLHFKARGPISAYIDAAVKADRTNENIEVQGDVKGGAP